MMSNTVKNIEGLYYPEFHPGWGGCADELFHHASRYYGYTEAFLRNMAGRRRFRMAGYSPALLSNDQRLLLGAVLSCEPQRRSARAVLGIVNTVLEGKHGIDPLVWTFYQTKVDEIAMGVLPASRQPREIELPLDVAPLDPFLNITERLSIPVVVRGHHLEVSLHALAMHLDSPNPVMRTNLQNAILQLHSAGYQLKNHPGLTHAECLG